MRNLPPGAFVVLVLFTLFCVPPASAHVSGEPGWTGSSDSPLDRCQSQYAEALRLADRERDYRADKARYAEDLQRRCAGAKWYDLGLLECLLLVPVFGLFLPFFGFILVGTLRSGRNSPSPESLAKEAETGNVR
jgi:hypothetical protein